MTESLEHLQRWVTPELLDLSLVSSASLGGQCRTDGGDLDNADIS